MFLDALHVFNQFHASNLGNQHWMLTMRLQRRSSPCRHNARDSFTEVSWINFRGAFQRLNGTGLAESTIPNKFEGLRMQEERHLEVPLEMLK
jgi:hypothetical protein